jgi:hypothetical protein
MLSLKDYLVIFTRARTTWSNHNLGWNSKRIESRLKGALLFSTHLHNSTALDDVSVIPSRPNVRVRNNWTLRRLSLSMPLVLALHGWTRLASKLFTFLNPLGDHVRVLNMVKETLILNYK